MPVSLKQNKKNKIIKPLTQFTSSLLMGRESTGHNITL